MSDRLPGLISLSEYISLKDFRVDQDDIEPRVLYVAMFRLRPEQGYEAAKLPLLVRDITTQKMLGQLTTQVAFFDLDLATVIQSEATFDNGYWDDPYKKGGRLTDNSLFGRGGKLDITQAYLRTDDGPEEIKLRDIERLSVPDNQLVSV